MAKLTLEQVIDSYSWHDTYYDLYPGYSKPVKKDEDWQSECLFDCKEAAVEMAKDLLWMFNHMPDPIPVYRVVGVDKLEDLDLEHPGWCWSWMEESAIGFAGQNGIPRPWVLLRGYAPKSKVDWASTLGLYHEYSGGGDHESENEIRIQGKDVKNVKAKMLKRT